VLSRGSADARRCAVIGSPIAHSLSPVLHRAAYAALGLGWTYDAEEVEAADLASFLAGLGPEWAGLSLTRPLKSAALAVAADADPVARQISVANTLVRRRQDWVAHNTDAPGLRQALDEGGIGAVASACVLGGGATARSSIFALADRVDRVQVLVRSARRSAGLTVLGLPVRIEVRSIEDPAARRAGTAAELVVDTTPPGAVDWLAAEVRPGSGTYVDWTYAPWPTALATAYGEAGWSVVGGHALLLHQAALQVELMTGQPAPLEAMRAALDQ
jgi:shikimate dehydrogenase